MKEYSFIQEFSGNCAAGLTGVETLATRPSIIKPMPVKSLVKQKPKRINKSVIKKSDTGTKSLVR